MVAAQTPPLVMGPVAPLVWMLPSPTQPVAWLVVAAGLPLICSPSIRHTLSRLSVPILLPCLTLYGHWLTRSHAFWLLGAFTDGFTIVVSVFDILTDMLMLLEFQNLGYTQFFNASLLIFALAQASYAFLFVATFAAHRCMRARVGLFFAVLPLAQLVPLFTWLESFHLDRVDKMLRKFQLRPTVNAKEQIGADANDSLWGFVQTKYQSHAGFLVEAFVEAVPQAVLQTVFVMVTGGGSTLNSISAGISILTIASKGFLVSYALDTLTFLFNFLCIITDCVGLFASSTLLVAHGHCAMPAYTLTALAASGLALSVAGGHGLLWFTMFDDHMKARNPKQWPGIVQEFPNVSFDIYLVRTISWCLAIVPCVVFFLGARLSLLPTCVLHSVDPNLVRHARFFRYLERFLCGHAGGTSERASRLSTTNAFLARARRNSGRLVSMLENTSRQSQSARAATVQRWASQVGVPQDTGLLRPFRAITRKVEEKDDALQRAIFNSFDSGVAATDIATLQSRVRRLRVVSWFERRARHAQQILRGRSEIFRNGCFSNLRSQFRDQLASLALRLLGVMALAFNLSCSVPLFVVYMLLVPLGVVFPLFLVTKACAECSTAIDASALPCFLSLTYCIALLSVVTLAPFVARKQLIWMDVVDLHELPVPFYSGIVLAEIRKRYLCDSMLRQRLGNNLASHTRGFLEE